MRGTFNTLKYIVVLILLVSSGTLRAKNDSTKTKTRDYISLGAGLNIPLAPFSGGGYYSTDGSYGPLTGCIISLTNTWLFKSGMGIVLSANAAYNGLNVNNYYADYTTGGYPPPEVNSYGTGPFRQASLLVGCSYSTQIGYGCMLGIRSMIGLLWFENSRIIDSSFGVYSYSYEETVTELNYVNLYMFAFDIGIELRLPIKNHEAVIGLDYMLASDENGLNVSNTYIYNNQLGRHIEPPEISESGIAINYLALTVSYGLCVNKQR